MIVHEANRTNTINTSSSRISMSRISISSAYIYQLRTNTNTMTRIEGKMLGIMTLFNNIELIPGMVYTYLLCFRSYYGECS